MSEDNPLSFLFDFLERLKSSQLLMLLAGLFLLDLVIPDPIPFVDEIILGLLTFMAARWKSRPASKPPEKPPTKNVTPEVDR